MIHKKCGQALIEFVIILPIFIFMIFSVIDFGKILYFENNLESKMDDIITIYEKEKDISKIEELLNLDKAKEKLSLKEENEYLKFSLEKDVIIITPGLNIFLKNPYKINIERVIYHE